MALAVPHGGATPPTLPLAGPGEAARSAIEQPQAIALPVPPSRATHKSTRQKLTDLTVIVVNFCQWRNTARLTRQLRKSVAHRAGSAEIVIVDNHSPSHPLIRRLKQLKGIAIRRFSRNHGFARAVNRGCQLISPAFRTHSLQRPQWILLLNPDVTVPDGFLDEVLGSTDRLSDLEPKVGVVGFRLRNRDGSGQASSGPHPTLPNTIAGLLRPRSRRKCRHQDSMEKQPVAWVTGGCLLVRRDCFEELGGFDESYFLYYEDVDFCRRATKAGWSVRYDPSLEVTHHWPLHARRVPAPLRLMTRHALLNYARKHWSGWQLRMLGGLIWVEAAVRQVSAAIRGDRDSATCYGELRMLVGDLRCGRIRMARRRIHRAAAFLDPIAAEQDGRT